MALPHHKIVASSEIKNHELRMPNPEIGLYLKKYNIKI